MLLHAKYGLAVHCEQCCSLTVNHFSLFGPAGQEHRRVVTCDCGERLSRCSWSGIRQLWVRAACGVCETRHLLPVDGRRLRHGEIVSLVCPATGVEVGFVGPAQAVDERVPLWEDELDEMFSSRWAEFFESPHVMYEMLDILQSWAESGELRCRCGSAELDLKLFPDRVELRCQHCTAADVYPAVSEGDLARTRNGPFARREPGQTGFHSGGRPPHA